MEFIKKQGAGFYLTAISTVLAVVGLVFYLINCNTAYFSNLGIHPGVLGCLVIAILAEIGMIAGNESMGEKQYFDIMPVIASVSLIVGVVLFISVRVAEMASIMTFENNAQNMADLSSAIFGIGFCLAAYIVSLAASFFSILKTRKIEVTEEA